MNIEELLAQGKALAEQERYEEALPYYDQVLALDPHNARAYRGKGVTLTDNEEALAMFDKALRFWPTNTYALYHKGVVLSRLEKYEEATYVYKD